MQQISDLLEECESLYAFLKQQDHSIWNQVTLFKSWSVNAVIQHLYFLDQVALVSLDNPNNFGPALAAYSKSKQSGLLAGTELLESWASNFRTMCSHLKQEDPQKRLPWFGPSMSVKTMATARQMETWAHGQEIYDLLRVKRIHEDRIKNICVLGVKTFSWSFINRKLTVPEVKPYILLDSPSGDSWQWNEASNNDYIKGSASDFCHVVTQGRNIADTQLSVGGDAAKAWMDIAQCFAGKAENPPSVGKRSW